MSCIDWFVSGLSQDNSMFEDISFFASDFIVDNKFNNVTKLFEKCVPTKTMTIDYIVRRGVDPWGQGQYGYALRHKKKAFQSKANRLFSQVNKFEEVWGVWGGWSQEWVGVSKVKKIEQDHSGHMGPSPHVNRLKTLPHRNFVGSGIKMAGERKLHRFLIWLPYWVQHSRLC